MIPLNPRVVKITKKIQTFSEGMVWLVGLLDIQSRKESEKQLAPHTVVQGCRFVPYTFWEAKPQMVPRDLNIGFQGLALIQGQIYNPVVNWAE